MVVLLSVCSSWVGVLWYFCCWLLVWLMMIVNLRLCWYVCMILCWWFLLVLMLLMLFLFICRVGCVMCLLVLWGRVVGWFCVGMVLMVLMLLFMVCSVLIRWILRNCLNFFCWNNCVVGVFWLCVVRLVVIFWVKFCNNRVWKLNFLLFIVVWFFSWMYKIVCNCWICWMVVLIGLLLVLRFCVICFIW